MKTNATQVAPASLNGINVQALQNTVEAITRTPSEGKTSWRVASEWKGGTRADHHVNGCSIGGKFVPREFTIRSDEPEQLCGTNRFSNPQELLMAGLNACMMVGYAAVAATMGITLTKLEVETKGDIDLRGFLGIDTAVPAGYRGLTQTVHIAGDGTEEQFARLHDVIRATSPNFYNLTRAIPTESRLIVDECSPAK
ncbi:MAG: OsmC family protein [Phycisphaeraceae bacterium]|nr:OsmC family protein [Phycisphaeraceae bacterium]